MLFEILITVALGIVGAAIAATIESYFEKKSKKEETLEDRINKLTSALKESSHLISEVEQEIKSRKKLVSELQEDAEKYQKLISLNHEQVDAVAQLLQGELRKESSKSLWKSAAVSFIFFIMGASLSWYLANSF